MAQNKNSEYETGFCHKTLCNYFEHGCYEQAAGVIKLHKDSAEAKKIFLKECFSIINSALDGKKSNPRKALDLIEVEKYIPEEWRESLLRKYASLSTDKLNIIIGSAFEHNQPNPRKALDLIRGIEKHISVNRRESLLDKYANLSVDILSPKMECN